VADDPAEIKYIV